MTPAGGGSGTKAIAAAGLLAGVMDITAAFVTAKLLNGVSPEQVLHYVASGAIGRDASIQGGWKTAALGLFFHFVVAFGAATTFYLASRRIVFLADKPFVSGPLYGIAVYVFMYWIVVPLSAIQGRTVTLRGTVIAIITHIVCVGTPIALMVRKFGN